MYCIKCGKKLEDNVKFCIYCGAKVFDIVEDQLGEVVEVSKTKNEKQITKGNTSNLGKKNKSNYKTAVTVIIAFVILSFTFYLFILPKQNQKFENHNFLEGSIEITRNDNIDYNKMDSWLLDKWEKTGNISSLKNTYMTNDEYYTFNYQIGQYGNLIKLEAESYNPYEGKRTTIIEDDFGRSYCYCVANGKAYIALELEYDIVGNYGIKVTNPTEIWCYDLETKDKTLLIDNISIYVDRIFPMENGIFISGLKYENSDDYFDFLADRDWNMVIGYNGNIIVPMQEKLFSGVYNAYVSGENIVSDGKYIYAGLTKYNSNLEIEEKICSDDYGETVALNNNRIFYTDSTGTQMDPNPIEYLIYYDLSTGGTYHTNLDAHYRNLSLLSIPCVHDSMVYAVYSDENINDVYYPYGKNSDINYFIYRYDMENNTYIPVNNEAKELEKN